MYIITHNNQSLYGSTTILYQEPIFNQPFFFFSTHMASQTTSSTTTNNAYSSSNSNIIEFNLAPNLPTKLSAIWKEMLNKPLPVLHPLLDLETPRSQILNTCIDVTKIAIFHLPYSDPAAPRLRLCGLSYFLCRCFCLSCPQPQPLI